MAAQFSHVVVDCRVVGRDGDPPAPAPRARRGAGRPRAGRQLPGSVHEDRQRHTHQAPVYRQNAKNRGRDEHGNNSVVSSESIWSTSIELRE